MGKPSQNSKIKNKIIKNNRKKRVCKDWFLISNYLPIKLLCDNILILIDKRSNTEKISSFFIIRNKQGVYNQKVQSIYIVN